MLQAIGNILQGLDPESLADESTAFLEEFQHVLADLAQQKKPEAHFAVEVGLLSFDLLEQGTATLMNLRAEDVNHNLALTFTFLLLTGACKSSHRDWSAVVHDKCHCHLAARGAEFAASRTSATGEGGFHASVGCHCGISLPPRLTIACALISALESVRHSFPCQGPRLPRGPTFMAAAGAVRTVLR